MMRRVILIPLLLIALTLAACGKKDNTPPTATPVPLPPTAVASPTPTPLPSAVTDTNPLTRALLRIVDASPDLPAVNVYLNGTSLGRGFTPGTYLVNPLAFSAGSYLLRVVRAGENPDVATPFLAQPIELGEGQNLVVVLTGTADALQIVTTQENLNPLPDQTARLSVMHAVLRGQVFDVQEANLNLMRQVDFGMTAGPIEVQAGDHALDLVSGPDQLASLDLYLSERYAYTVVLFKDASGSYQTLNFRDRVSDESRIRVIHASPDMPAVNVLLDGAVMGENLAYHEATDWATYPSMPHQLRVVPAGDSSARAIMEKQVTLIPNKAVDIVLLDTVERLRVVPVEEDLSPTAEGSARLIFVQAATGSIQVSIQTLNGGEIPDLLPISFGTTSRPISYPAGAAGFMFMTADTQNQREIDFLPERRWDPGYAYLIVVTGTADVQPLVLETEVGTAAAQASSGAAPSVTLPTAPALATFQVRLVNALPETMPLDLLVNGTLIFDSVQHATGTAYHTLPTEPKQISIHATDSGATLIDDQIALPASSGPTPLTLIVYRDHGDARYQIIADPAFMIPQGQALLRVVHLATDRPTLIVTRLSPPTPVPETPEGTPASGEGGPQPPGEEPLSSGADFGVVPDPQAIPAGTYAVRIVEKNTGTVVLTVPPVTFESGVFYDLLLLPDSSGLSLSPVLVPHGEP
jgi:predicted small lipoprotein YifL